MSEQKRPTHWQTAMNNAIAIPLVSHSKPGQSIQCRGSINTLPDKVRVKEERDSMDRLISSVVGECPICGRVFNFKATERRWIIPKEIKPRYAVFRALLHPIILLPLQILQHVCFVGFFLFNTSMGKWNHYSKYITTGSG